jgi:hypothetical protein
LAVFSLYTENENVVVTMLSHGQTRGSQLTRVATRVWLTTRMYSHKLSSTLSRFKLWWKLTKLFARLSSDVQSTLMQLLF